MAETSAVRVALEIMHMPSRVRVARAAPLPAGILLVLSIAAGDDEALAAAAEALDRSKDSVRDAAAFFIEQILLAPGSDSYRVLAAAPDATAGELRRNMALLLRWLHPDKDTAGERSRFAARVTLAWDDLKTPERRQTYDTALREGRLRSSSPSARRHRVHAREEAALAAAAPAAAPWAGVATGASQTVAAPNARGAPTSDARPASLVARALHYLFG